MITDEKLTKWNYENLFKELYKDRDNKKEGIYLLFTENPEVIKYLNEEEKAGVTEIILNMSNLKINNLEGQLIKLKKELLKDCYAQ